MILIIDNYDSFTYNLYQQIEGLGAKTRIFKNDEICVQEIEKLAPRKIVISPGPGHPRDSKISLKVIKKFHTKIPILGVCLGHQAIGEVFGVKTIRAKYVLHGKTSEIYYTEKGLFSNVKNPLIAARYHSLVLSKIPKNFTLTAWDEHNEIMAIQHEIYPIFGVQFHPESFLTEEGNIIMKNFLNA